MVELASNQRELLRVLVEHGVDFVVLGGVAAQINGWEGATLDLDVAVSTEEANVDRINRALADVQTGQPRVGGFGTAFTTVHGRLEIVRRADGIGHYENWLARASLEVVAEGLEVLVAAPRDILTSKSAAGREKDLAVLSELEAAFERAGRLEPES